LSQSSSRQPQLANDWSMQMSWRRHGCRTTSPRLQTAEGAHARRLSAGDRMGSCDVMDDGKHWPNTTLRPLLRCWWWIDQVTFHPPLQLMYTDTSVFIICSGKRFFL